MSQGSDTNQPVTVSNDGINIEKSVAADEFPVPAVKFVLTSNAASPVRIRLTDQIPESFPMERVGFHPDFHSDSWTAYKNHRVEFEHELDSGESLTTVYGIRTDDEEKLQEHNEEIDVDHRQTKIKTELGRGNVAEAQTQIEQLTRIHGAETEAVQSAERQTQIVMEGGREEQSRATKIVTDEGIQK